MSNDARYRFAQFFVKPLFKHDCIAKEMNAVNSEHEKNIKDDVWRFQQVWRQVLDPKSPATKFGTGTLQTLNRTDIEARLHSFYKEHYTAGLMQLSVVGRESLDELEKAVVDLFSNVPVNPKTSVSPVYDSDPFGESAPKKLVLVKTLTSMAQLGVYFQLPDMLPFLATKPVTAISLFLESKRRGGLYDSLKGRSLATGVEAGLQISVRGFSVLYVKVRMTDKGFDQYQDVLESVFAAIALARIKGIPERFFWDYKQLRQIDFDYASAQIPRFLAKDLVEVSQPFSAEEILIGPVVPREYDPAAISEILAKLTIDNCFVAVASHRANVEANRMIEKWYGTEYSVSMIGDSLARTLEDATGLIQKHPELTLPDPNKLIATSFAIYGKKADSSSPVPTKIDMGPGQTLWHKLDDTFLLPKAYYVFVLHSKAIDGQEESGVPLGFFLSSFLYHYTEEDSDAKAAGLTYACSVVGNVIALEFSGFHQHLPAFMETVVKRLLTFECTEQEFSVFKEKAQDSVKNRRNWQAYLRAEIYSYQAMSWPSSSEETTLKILDGLTVKDLASIRDVVFQSPLQLDGLVAGNVAEDEARAVFARLKAALQPPSSASWYAPVPTIVTNVQLQPSVAYTLVVLEPIADVNHAVSYYLQAGSFNDRRVRTLVGLFEVVFKDLVFSTLRTQQQLGYIVSLQRKNTAVSTGLVVTVQSPAFTPPEIEKRVDALLASLPSRLEEMADGAFLEYKRAWQAVLRAKPQNMAQVVQAMGKEVLSQRHEFNSAMEQADFLETITKKDLAAFIDDYIVPGGSRRSKLSFHVWPRESAGAVSTPESIKAKYPSSEDLFFSIDDFKKKQSFFPLA